MNCLQTPQKAPAPAEAGAISWMRPDQARPITVKLLMNGPAIRGSLSIAP